MYTLHNNNTKSIKILEKKKPSTPGVILAKSPVPDFSPHNGLQSNGSFSALELNWRTSEKLRQPRMGCGKK